MDSLETMFKKSFAKMDKEKADAKVRAEAKELAESTDKCIACGDTFIKTTNSNICFVCSISMSGII